MGWSLDRPAQWHPRCPMLRRLPVYPDADRLVVSGHQSRDKRSSDWPRWGEFVDRSRSRPSVLVRGPQTRPRPKKSQSPTSMDRAFLSQRDVTVGGESQSVVVRSANQRWIANRSKTMTGQSVVVRSANHRWFAVRSTTKTGRFGQEGRLVVWAWLFDRSMVAVPRLAL